jgi:hypothetical protein
MQLQRVATETHLAQKLSENLRLAILSTAKTRSSNKSIIQLYKTDLKPLLAIFGTAMRARLGAMQRVFTAVGQKAIEKRLTYVVNAFEFRFLL